MYLSKYDDYKNNIYIGYILLLLWNVGFYTCMLIIEA